MNAAADLTGLLASLPGRWRIDERASTGERHTGVAVARRIAADAVEFEERGAAHTHAATPLTWTRRRRWSVSADGRLVLERAEPVRGWVSLLTIAPARVGIGIGGAGAHRCGDDLYHARLTLAPRTIVIEWDVRGPAKRYRLRSVYTADAGDAVRRALAVSSR